MKKIVKKISVILVVSICVTILAPCKSVYAYTQTAAATNDYTTWKQTSSTWGDATPWPNASIPKFGDAGCWITSVAILLRHYGVVTDSNVNTFNPLICNNRLMSYGIVNNQGDFCNLQNMKNAYPGFEYVGTKNYSFSNLKSLYDQGYACIVHETRGHYVAVRSVSSSSAVIMDPGYSTTSLTASDSIQYFKATKQPIPDVTGTQVISDGEYHIVSKLNENYYLDIASTSASANAQIGTGSNLEADTNSIVNVKHIGEGNYMLTFKRSGHALDVYNSGTASGTNVIQYTVNNGKNQQWIIKEAEDGWFYIISKCSGMYLDVQGGGTPTVGQNVQVYSGNGSDAQKWKFVASGLSTGRTIDDGEYHINTGLNIGFGLDIESASLTDKANVHIWNNYVKDSQKWNVKYLGNGFYSIKNKNSGLALATASPWTYKSTNVYQFHETPGKDQRWIIKPAGNGFYYLVNELGGMYLDVSGGGTATNGQNVQLYIGNYTIAQKWAFARQKETENKIVFDLQGGAVEGSFASYKGNVANVGRGSGELAVFTISDMKVETNQFGKEAAVGSDGAVTEIRDYGSNDQLYVPSNGMVVSGHLNSEAINGASFVDQLKLGDYVGYDEQTCEVKAYHDPDGYLVENKYVLSGNKYGTLPVPKREGYIFEGWFTETDGGIKVAYDVTYMTSRLYAHWTRKDQARPVVATTYNERKYEVYDYSMSWNDAKEFCEKRGGHLVTIKDKAENDFITSLIKQGNKNYYHIGCTDEEEEGVWKWITGEDFSYNNWDSQAPEPNGGTNENYGAIISIENPPNKQSGEWMDGYNYYNSDDYYSSRNAGFVCEYETIQKEISDCTIELESTQYTYDGKEKKPKVTIKDGTEELLIDVDYTIVYNNYIDAGIATVTITGKGNYTGKHTKIYGIAKATQDMKASVTKTSFIINDKEQIKTTGIGTITYISSNTLVATVTATGQITAVGEGEATITVEATGDSNYKSASKNIEIVVTEKENENIPKLSFVDVPKDAWFFDYVKDIYNEKLMTGLDATHFGALDSLARAQFAVILHRMYGDTDEAYMAKFPDVPNGIWFTDAVLWANKNGVITGYSHNGHFGPGDKITREQMAVMMYRYANYMGYDTGMKEDFSRFNDAAKVNDFAKEAMQWAVGNGIITGKNNGTALDPQGNASRAECATIIMRFMEKYGK